MTVNPYLILALTSAVYVATRSLQQRNVVNDNWLWIIPTSFLMAMGDVFIVSHISKDGHYVPLVFSLGLGAGIGCMLGMAFHKRYVK